MRRPLWHPLRRRAALLTVSGVALIAACAGLAGCTPLTTLNGWLVPQEGYVRHTDFAYGDQPRQRLDVYAPWPDADSDRPVVIFFYGGSWKGGRRDYYPFVGEALTSRGFVVVIPDYRVYPDVTFPTFIEDGAAVVRWTEQTIHRFGGNPQRIVLMGHSAGAHIAAMLIADDRYLTAAAVTPLAIQGFVGVSGPYAFDPLSYRTLRPIFADANRPTMPVSLIDGSEPPMLLLHGRRDRTVLPVNSHALADRSRVHGGIAEVIEFDDLGHIDILLSLARPLRSHGGVLDEVSAFVNTRTAPAGQRAASPSPTAAVPSETAREPVLTLR